MEQNISTTLEGLTLANLNDKLQAMRDQLRKNVDQDLEYVRFKMGSPNKEESKHTSRQSSYKTQSEIAEQLRQNASLPIQPSPSTPPFPGSGVHPEVTSYKNFELAERKIDLQELRKINRKKLTVGQLAEYVRYVLHEDVWEKIKEIWEKIQDVEEKVKLGDLVQKINKLSVKFSEAIAFQIPKIQRNIPLKKVLFDIQYKTKRFSGEASWDQFQTIIHQYIHPEEPQIDVILEREKDNRALNRNYFNIPVEIVNELKVVYHKCSRDYFLTFCSTEALVAKMESSNILTKNRFTCVRPKSNYELQYTVNDAIKYFGRKAPEFVDLDEFLLFFTVRDFTCYPIEERINNGFDSTITDDSKQIKRVRSDKIIPKQKIKEKYHFDEYLLSNNKVESIRNKRLRVMLENEEEKAAKQLKHVFKAKPIPSSLSQQKYKQFLEGIERKKLEANEQLKKRRESQQKIIQKLRNNTRLFNSPKHRSPNDTQPKNNAHQVTIKPVPNIVKTPRLELIQNQKNERRNKIFSENKEKYQKSWQQLGKVAQAHAPCSKQKPESFQYRIPIKQIPDYRSEQQKIEYELQCRRQQYQPTRIEQFYFRTEERHPHHMKEISIPLIQSQQYYDYRKIIYSQQPEIYYTKKFADQLMANKKRAYQREKNASKELKEELERQKKHKNFAKFMKNNLAALPNTAKMNEIEAKIKIERHKKYWKNLDRQHENKLNQIYTKILKRPFLYELQTARSASKEIRIVHSPAEKRQKGKGNTANAAKHERKPTGSQYHEVNRSF